MKRLLCALLLFSAFACRTTDEVVASEWRSAPSVPEAKNVGILIFDGLFITEFVAPFDVYKHVGDRMNVFTVGLTSDPMRSA